MKNMSVSKRASFLFGIAFAIIFISLLSHQAAAIEQSYFSAKYLDIITQVDGTISASYQPYSSLDYLDANLSLYPKKEYSDIIAQNFIPRPYMQNSDATIFRWNTLQSQYRYSVTTQLKNSYLNSNITSPRKYPLSGIPDKYNIYTQPSEYVDSNNPQIEQLAAQLAEGQTDLFSLEMKIVNYVNSHVSYNLTTTNEDTTYKASEVLQRGNGVCDEITVLFMAINRALGIPARYVSGYSYTDVFTSKGSWAGHSWAEIWTGSEWVPFDLTYGDYLQLSPVHVAFKKSVDPKESSTKFSWRSSNVKLTEESLNVSVQVTGKGSAMNFGSLSAAFMNREVRFGSYNLLQVNITNNRDFAVIPSVALSNTQGLSYEDPAKSVIIYPHESKTLYYLVKVSGSLDKGYVYTVPVEVFAKGFDPSTAKFTSNSFGPMYFKDDFSIYFSNSTVKKYINNISLNCDTKHYYVSDSRQEVYCTLKNLGNTNYNNLQVCLEDCSSLTLLINQKKSLNLSFSTGSGPETKSIRIRHYGTTISVSPFSFDAVDIAEGNVSITTNGKYWPSLVINAQFTKPIDGKLYVTNNRNVIAEYNFKGEKFNETITPGLSGYDMKSNNITAAFQFHDISGDRTIKAEKKIVLSDSFETKTRLFLSRAVSYIKNLFSQAQ